MSIHLVVAVHCVQMSIHATELTSPKAYAANEFNEEMVQKAQGFIKGLTQIGIPIFFYCSGINLSHFKHSKGFKVFLKSKVMRLLVPFLVAFFTILPPRLYLT